jgi:hypothetical protein
VNVTARVKPLEIPFESWIAAGNVSEIPLTVEVSSPHLSILQRLVVNFRAAVSAKAVRALGPRAQLFFAVRLRPAGGAWIEDGVFAGMNPVNDLPKNAFIEFRSEALVLPGEYTVGFILYDSVTGRHSSRLRQLRVPRPSGDPLAETARNLPPVEFFIQSLGENSAYPAEPRARLWMPVPTRRPVRVELLVNFSPSEQFDGLTPVHMRNTSTMLGMLRVLAQMEVPNGSLHITALDLLHRQVVFEQDNVRSLNLRRLHNALAQINPLRVSVQDLEERRRNAAFFRGVLQDLLQPTSSRPARGGEASPEPYRVFVLLSSPQLFTEHSDLDPLPPLEGCDCRIYHLQYRINSLNIWDQLPRILRELHPTRFQLESPADFRRALARILAELRGL